MGYRGDIAKLVKAGIKLTGNIAEDLFYVETTSSSYDTATSRVTETEIRYRFKGVVSSAPLSNGLHSKGESIGDSNPEVEESTSDLKVIFASLDLAVTPKSTDTIERKGEIYQIKRITGDPAGGSYSLRIGKL